MHDVGETLSSPVMFLLNSRKWLGLFLGAFVGLSFLLTKSFISGISASPRSIVSQGWQKTHAAVSGQRDGFRNFNKNAQCNFSTLDIHRSFSPLCNDRKSLLEAMSGGGRIGLDAPYQTRQCDMQWFSTSEICNILSRYDHIYLIGDSMLRHTAQAFNVLLREDLVNGGRATWRNDEDPLNCRCYNVFDNPGCVWMSAINTIDVLLGDRKSIRCSVDKRLALITWIPMLNYPLTPETMAAFFSTIENKNTPNGRDIFIMDHGIWNDLEAESSMSWIEQVEDAMYKEMPAFFRPDIAARLFPRLFITPSAQGEGKPDIFVGIQNNIRLMRHTKEISLFVKERGYEHLAFYNLTVQASSPDGTHATYENNLMKAMMVLNWLNMLDPPIAATRRPESLTATVGGGNTPLPDPWYKQAAPADASMIPTSTKGQMMATILHGIPAAELIQSAESNAKPTAHPIDELVARANDIVEQYLRKSTSGVEEAAAVYRQRRGRHPPPSFDQWVKFAEEKGALMVEDFFDQIYHDLEHFWDVDASEIRAFPASWPYLITIRNGTLRRWTDEPPNIAPWLDLWEAGFSGLPLDDLPDIDLAFNGEDEPKLFVPWETINEHIKAAEPRKHTDRSTASQPIFSDFSSYPPLPSDRPKDTEIPWADFPEDWPLWLAAREACEPTSPARIAHGEEDYSKPPTFPSSSLDHMYDGYVSNWSEAKSACANPNIRNYHASFIAMQSYSNENPMPNRQAVIKTIVPLLAGCKIHDVNSEILIPPAMQWPNAKIDSDFGFHFKEGSSVPWEKKQNVVMWRGSASGGINTADNWTRFQRHRFLAMLNGTLAAAHERVADKPLPRHVPGGRPPLPHNFPLPNQTLYHLAPFDSATGPTDLGDWISNHTDAAFVHLRCYPPPSWFGGDGSDCPYSGPYYTVKPILPATEMSKYKYQPDIDGASYSGRYRAILQSNSLPMKATIYDEWHDSRLVPWKHFVPMDVSNVDMWGLMEYFFGYKEEREAHDGVAKRIAEEGSKWTRKVIRTEDMLVYVYRLILELARLSDDRRDRMGYVGDL